ncbi:MAG: hypothetical protein P1V81_09970 [Planctomycetota bacterium]|nr:hypothetical protein [Planctomycetota bacterium]
MQAASRQDPGPSRASGTGARRIVRGLALGALLGACLVSCAALDSDWHLAPIYSSQHRFDGGHTTEFAGGAVLFEDPPTVAAPAAGAKDASGKLLEPGEPRVRTARLINGELDERFGRKSRALRPLVAERWHADGDRTFEWLPPLGRTTWRGEELSSYFFPVYSARLTPENTKGRTFQMIVLPGFLWTQEADGTNHAAWLPFYGDLRDFLTFTRIQFVLFPLYLRTERAGNRTDSLLFPVLGYTRPLPEEEVTDPIAQLERRESHGWRIWPLYGHSRRENSYDRRFALWPILHWQDNHLERPEENHEKLRGVWPLFTSTHMGTYEGYTFLWPFFGWGRDPRGGFWALDAPWPLVRFQRGGANTGDVSRSRVWPLFSHMRGDNLEAWSVIWPFVQWRTESYVQSTRDSRYLLPFWRARHSVATASHRGGAAEGETLSRWRKLWPLWSEELEPGRHGLRRTTTLLPLNPLFEADFIDFHWAWAWQLYREVEDGPIKRERAWLGLWTRERNAAEDRRSLSGLWSKRVVDGPGGSYRETSLLFGLLRWRSSDADDDSGMLRPAFPGPGWPALEQPKPAPKPLSTPMVFPLAPEVEA